MMEEDRANVEIAHNSWQGGKMVFQSLGWFIAQTLQTVRAQEHW